MVEGCSFVSRVSNSEGGSEIRMSSVGDRSRRNACVEGGGGSEIEAREHCRDGVVDLDKSLWVMMTWL